jgi:Phytanoyl-CoA dioxygenase (PhyH)
MRRIFRQHQAGAIFCPGRPSRKNLPCCLDASRSKRSASSWPRPDLVAALRARVLDYAHRIGWLEPQAPIADARAAPGKRVGHHQDPDWVALQVDVQGMSEMWAVGDGVAIHRVLRAVEGRSNYLNLSTANTCRVYSPHPDMATQPHQDAHYVRMIGEFWTVWIPLGDCPRSLGPLALLAGSHHGALPEHAGQGIVEGGVAVPAEAVWSTTDFRCGDAVGDTA